MATDQDIQINLLNYKLGPELQRRKNIIIIASYLGLGIVLIAAMFILSAGKQARIAEAKNLNQQLKQEIKIQDYVVEGVLNDEKLKSALSSRQKLVQQIESNKLYYGEIFQDLDKMTLPGVIITNIEAKPGYVNFTGYISAPTDLGDVIGWFHSSECFGEIINLNSQLNKDNGEIEFKLSVAWKGGRR